MYTLDKEKAKQVLLDQKYSENDIHLLLDTYPSLPDDLGAIVDQWFVDQNVPEYAVDGLTIAQVMKTRQIHFLAAVARLGQLRDPALSEAERTAMRQVLTQPQIIQ